MKKRILAASLGALLLFSSCLLLLTGCGKRRISAKIGVLRGDASSTEALAWENYLRDLSAEMGVSIDFSKALESADDELSAVQNYASLGYNGIIAMTSYNPTSILKKCQDYGMYLTFAAAHPDFEESEHSLAVDQSKIITDYTDYDHYVGASGPSDYGEFLAGYQMGRAGVDAGYRKYSVFTGSAAYGQSMHALRIAGFFVAMHDLDPSVSYGGIACNRENWKSLTAALQKDLGVNLSKFSSQRFSILAQTGGYAFFQGDTAAVAAVANLSAVNGVEAVFCAGSADGIARFAPNGARCVYIGNDSLGETFETMFKEGRLIFDIAKYNSFVGPAFAMLLKSIYRDEAVRINGKPVSVEQESLQITGTGDYETINSVENKKGGYFYSSEFLSAYLLETDLGENESGHTVISDEVFRDISSLPSTLGEGGLYRATRAVSEAFKNGNHEIFQFATEKN